MTDSPAPQTVEPGPAAPATTRRVLLMLAGLIAGATGVLVGLPIVSVFAAPLFRRPDRSEEQEHVIALASEFGGQRQEREFSFPAQDGWYTKVQTHRVVVEKKSDTEFIVFSTVCPHLRCGVSWNAEAKQFYCPCHAGVFNEEGVPISGPPPRPLDRLPARVNERGELVVKVKES